MSKADPIWTGFQGGELSPRIHGRVDMDRYPFSAEQLENLIVRSSGAAEKRPGLVWKGELHESSDGGRLLPFEFSRTQAYVLEFGDEICRPWYDGALVATGETQASISVIGVGATTAITTTAPHLMLTGDWVTFVGVTGADAARLNGRWFKVTVTGASTFNISVDTTGLTLTATGTIQKPVEIKTPYAAADLGELSWAQSADVLFLAHPSYPPQKISRLTATYWQMTTLLYGVQLDRPVPVSAITKAASAVATTTVPHEIVGNGWVLISKARNMYEINGLLSRATPPSKTTLTLHDIDSSLFHDFMGSDCVIQAVNRFEWPAFDSENINTDVEIVASNDVAGGSVTLVATRGIFTADMIGSFVKIREVPEIEHPKWATNVTFNGDIPGGMALGDSCQYEGNVYKNISQSGSTGTIPPTHDTPGQREFDKKWQWEFANRGSGYVEIRALVDAYTVTGWIHRRLPESAVDTNGGKTLTTSTPGNPYNVSTAAALHGFSNGDEVFIWGTNVPQINGRRFTVANVGGGGTTFDLSGEDGTTYGTITTGFVIRINNATEKWSIGAWNEEYGYPRAVVFYEDRLIWASTTKSPQTLWMSETAFYESLEETNVETSALVFTLNAQDMNAIEFLRSAEQLVIGTAGGVFIGAGLNPNEALGLENPLKATLVYPNGAASFVTALSVDGVILFVQKAKRRLREFLFDDNSGSYLAADLAEVAEHLTRPGIKWLANHREPWRMIWVGMDDGTVAGIVYDRSERVTGWSRFSFGGTDTSVEWAVTIPSATGDEDEVYFQIARTIGGATKRYIERLDAEWYRGRALADGVFADAAVAYSGGAVSSLTNADHLIGQTVAVIGDGTRRDDVVVPATGIVTVSGTAASKIVYGLLPANGSRLRTLRPEGGNGLGTAQGKWGRTNTVTLRLYDTGEGLYFGEDFVTMDMVRMSDEQDPLATIQSLFNGDTRELTMPSGHSRSRQVALRHAEPFPCTILAIMPRIEVEERD